MGKAEKTPDFKGFTLKLDNEEDDLSVTIKGYYGENEHVIIPECVQGLKIKKIDGKAFKGNEKVKKITIEKGITVVEAGTFEDCTELTEVELPDGLLEIKYDAFKGCKKLAKIKFPESILSINESAFEGSEELTSVYIPKDVKNLYKDTFQLCAKLKEIIADDENLYFSTPDGVLLDKTQTTLIRYPEGKKDTNYIVPDTVIDIENDAFKNCKELAAITLPNRLYYIGAGSFDGCEKLEKITVQDGNPRLKTIDGVLFNKEEKTLLFYPFNRKETEYNIPDGIEHIRSGAFFNCKNLKSVSFPESLRMIRIDAFRDCENLVSITLPEKLKGICSGAFCGCKQLKKVTLSRKTRIGHDAFEGLSAEFVYIGE
jgi:hypothetical protein